MLKNKEELNKLKQEYQELTVKLKELTEDELNEVTGGTIGGWENIEHSDMYINNQGQYYVYYGDFNIDK